MIAVSFLKSIYDRKVTIKKIDNSNADLIHVDLMDGLYLSEKNFELNEIMNDLKDTYKKLDIHLMVKNPLQYIYELVKLNVYTITIHLDILDDIDKIINFVHSKNIKVGIAINPLEDIHLIDKYLNKIDYVLVMSVTPGLGGQKFIPYVLDKVKYLEDKNVLIGIDGGINDTIMPLLEEYKIDIIVSGSFICMNEDYNGQINKLR